MGSIQQFHLEIPVAFIQALLVDPENTDTMLVDAVFDDKSKNNFAVHSIL
jgi:hypothetical protein